MKLRVLAAVAALLVPVPVAHASQAVYLGGPWGMLCGLASTSDPDGRQTGEINAGPLYFGAGSVTCTVQVGEDRYTGRNIAGATASGTGGVVMPSTPVTYSADGAVYVCTQVTIDGDKTALFLDDATGMWSRDPETARCSAAVESTVVGPARRGQGNGHAYGHQKAKPPNDDNPPPPPPAQPFYPTGTVTMGQDALTGYAVTYSGFTPALSSWACTTSGTSTSCTPPPPPSGYANVCGTVDVSAGDPIPGAITGTSACASGPAAVASEAFVSTAATYATASAGTAFPWVCTAAPQGAVTWTVTCSVGP